VQELKREEGGDIVVTGSITLCGALVAAGLVDQYRIFVHPVVQGRGRGLFPDDVRASRLTLRESRRFPSGVVLLTYAAA
jgi:dihydrofolate reductase